MPRKAIAGAGTPLHVRHCGNATAAAPGEREKAYTRPFTLGLSTRCGSGAGCRALRPGCGDTMLEAACRVACSSDPKTLEVPSPLPACPPGRKAPLAPLAPLAPAGRPGGGLAPLGGPSGQPKPKPGDIKVGTYRPSRF
eukprot:365072-Chlamydomonas_euryale.AAC.14